MRIITLYLNAAQKFSVLRTRYVVIRKSVSTQKCYTEFWVFLPLNIVNNMICNLMAIFGVESRNFANMLFMLFPYID
jgi:hypothetical protein